MIADPNKLLDRALKILAHAFGHLLGMRHCVYYKCVMKGAHSLAKMDAHPLHLCPVCLTKLQWNLGVDPLVWYRRLKGIFRRQGMHRAERDVDTLIASFAAQKPSH